MKYFAVGVSLLFLLVAGLPVAVAEDEPAPPPEPRRGGGRRMSPEAMWERLKGMDADGDGKISREEFQGPERFFDRLDEDEDGFLTEAETKTAMKRMAERRRQGGGGGGEGRPEGGEERRGAEGGPRSGGRRGAPPPPTGIALEIVDADRDGTITLAEWTMFFGAADADQDGTISSAEWARILKPVTRPGGRAPQVNEAAPDVKAVSLLKEDVVVDLGAPKRITVLIFGSWT